MGKLPSGAFYSAEAFLLQSPCLSSSFLNPSSWTSTSLLQSSCSHFPVFPTILIQSLTSSFYQISDISFLVIATSLLFSSTNFSASLPFCSLLASPCHLAAPSACHFPAPDLLFCATLMRTRLMATSRPIKGKD